MTKQQLKMEVLPNSYEVEDNFPFCVGKITINENNNSEPFWETFTLALDYWTIDDYKRQWREGLERIKTHNKSCLVASVQDPTKAPFILWWPLYKQNNLIYIQNELIVSDDYRRVIGNKTFSPDTCYDFIEKLLLVDEDGTKYSTWIIDL